MERIEEGLGRSVYTICGDKNCGRRESEKDIKCELELNCLALVEAIEERSPEIISEYRAKLELKVKELLEDVQMDESRLAAR